LLQNLEIDQKRSLLCQELERIKAAAKLDAKFLLGKVSLLQVPFLLSFSCHMDSHLGDAAASYLATY
jgi:hypothetical protein